MDKTRILIADDEPVNLDFFEVTLEKLGFDVYKAQDGYETLEKVKKVKPDLIILDNMIPKLSGWKVTSLLKTSTEYAAYSDIPIIMLSAMDNVRDKVEGLELGVEDYITKPFNFTEVYARIRAVMKNRLLSKQAVTREKRLATVESLNKSLVYFTEHIKKPLIDIKTVASDLNPADKTAMKTFLERVVRESSEVFAAIEGLEEEIKEIEADENIEFQTAVLDDLEDKFKKRYKTLKEEKFNEEASV